MTLNVISDLHCGFELKDKTVLWNGDSDSELSKRYINKMDKLLAKLFDNKFRFDNLDNKEKEHYETMLEMINDIIHSTSYKSFDFFKRNYGMLNYGVLAKLNSHVRSHVRELCTTFEYFQSMFNPHKLKPADYLLIAGDLGANESYEYVYNDIKEKTKDLFKDVFYIKGNHDYWDFSPDAENINLDHRYVEQDLGDNVVLLGCTMWSPIIRLKRFCETYMNDFRYIPGFTSQKQNELFNVESSWLREKVNFYKNNNKKVVVMTHHLPISDVVDAKYAQSNVNESYVVLDGSCDDILPDFWIHGHSHSTCRINKNGCTYIRNPIGYRILYGYASSEVIWHNWYDEIIEI